MRVLRIGLLVAVAVLAAGAWAQDGGTYYGLISDGKLLGYVRVTSTEGDRDGRAVETLGCELSVDVAALGQRILIHSVSTTVLDRATGEYLSYDWAMDRGELHKRFSCTVADGKMTLSRQTGDEEPVVSTVDYTPDTYVWGDNDMAALGLLVRRTKLGPGETKEIRVATPEGETALTLTALERATRTVRGVEMQVARLTIAGGVVLLSDPETGLLVGVEVGEGVPALELADESVVQAAQSNAGADVMASHFIRCTVPFADFMKVTRMKADIEIKATILAGALVRPESEIQTFEGSIVDNVVKGTITIVSRPYAGEGAEAFPVAPDPPEGVGDYLKPSPMIESDDQAIIDMAKQITEGATTTWEATERIAKWVSENIAYRIADAPNASLCLKTRQGDCGPHATLSTAMLRAVGIPAKMVGGLTYAPQYGGCFGQHAWTEAFVGGGWVSFDTTTGEIGSLSAVHVKIFEGLGAVQPVKLDILEHEGGSESAQGTLVVRPLPWQLDRDYVFTFRSGEKTLGTETVRFTRPENGDGYVAVADAVFGEGEKASTAARRVTLDTDLSPLTWQVETTAGGQTSKTALTFSGGKVRCVTESPGQPPLDQTVDASPDLLVAEGNSVLWLVVGAARMSMEPGVATAFNFLQPQGLMTMSFSFVTQLEPVEWSGIPCKAVDFPMIKARFFFTDDGRFLGEEGPGDIKIDVAP